MVLSKITRFIKKINSLDGSQKFLLEEGLRMTYSEYKKETHKQTLRYK